jgi:lysylphosphatidylglycerol synthetase-like protein (DUF2156 family)
MTLDQWLMKFDPSQFSLTVLVFMLTIAFIIVMWRKIIPFYIEKKWPADLEMQRLRIQEEVKVRQDAIAEQRLMREAVEKLNVVAGQQMLLLNQHDMTARSGIENLMEMITLLLQKNGIDTSKFATQGDQTIQLLAKTFNTMATATKNEGAAS